MIGPGYVHVCVYETSFHIMKLDEGDGELYPYITVVF